jgi:hypothetical protein
LFFGYSKKKRGENMDLHQLKKLVKIHEKMMQEHTYEQVKEGTVPVLLVAPIDNSKISTLGSLVQGITDCSFSYEKKEEYTGYIIELEGLLLEDTCEVYLETNKNLSFDKEMKKILRMNDIREIKGKQKEEGKRNHMTLYLHPTLQQPENDIHSFAKGVFSLIQLVHFLQEKK